MPLLQNKDIPSYMFKSMEIHLKIRQTTLCNARCEHCYAPAEDYVEKNQLLDHPEWVEACVKSQHIKYVHLQGGEPTLRPDVMEMCGDICRKYSKPFCIFTNGWKLMDDSFRKEVEDKVKPDIIICSFNKYLEAQTDQAKIVNTLAAVYKDHPTIYFGTTAMIDSSNMRAFKHFIDDGGWPPYDPAYFPEIEQKLDFDYWKFQLPLSPGGRTSIDNPDIPRCQWPRNFTACTFSTTLRPDGVLQADCGYGDLDKILFGHIDYYMPDPIGWIMAHHSKNFCSTKEPLNGFSDICSKDPNITCLESYPPGAR